MTEYDFSPEAVDAYVQKQYKIANWVDDTKRQPPANPFTPATPAVRALQIRREDDDTRHRRKELRNPKDRHQDRAIDPADIRHRGSSPTSTRPRSNRSHSASYTVTAARGNPTRGRTLPAPLHLPPQNGYISPGKPASPTYAYHPQAPKLMSPRDSKHSSQTSSSTWLPVNPHYTQPTPHSAPVIPRAMRSQTTPPNYTPPMHAAYHGGSGYLPVRSIPFIACPHCPDPEICSLKQNAPQFPHSYYQPKPAPLFKRLFMNWGSPKQHKLPRRKRSSSF